MKDKIMEALKYLGFIFLIFGVPVILYLVIKWDPIIGKYGDGEPLTLGYVIIFIFYWITLFLIYKYRSELKMRRKQIKRLINGSMSETEKSLLEKEIEMNL